MHLAVSWLDARCVVDAPADVGRVLGTLFGRLVGPAPGGAKPDVTVARQGGEFRVTPPPEGCGSPDGRATTMPEAVSLLELAVTRHLLRRETRHLHLHAAGVVAPGGSAVLALGPSGRGKSSLAAAWLAAGYPILGDDVVALAPDGRAAPLPRPLKLDLDRAAALGVDPHTTPARDPAAPDVWVVPGHPGVRAGRWAPGPVPVRVVAEIRFVAGAELDIRTVEPTAMLRLLLDSVHRSHPDRVVPLDPLVRLVEGARTLEVTHGDAGRAGPALLARAAHPR